MPTDKRKRAPRAVTRSELVADIARAQPELEARAVEVAVGAILERMAAGLAAGERIEIRGFGSLTLRHRPARAGRNPKTGETVQVAEKWAPHFKPGAALRARVNRAAKAAGSGKSGGAGGKKAANAKTTVAKPARAKPKRAATVATVAEGKR